MPRRPRYAPAGVPLHVVNRATDDRQLFFEATDYERFIALLAEARTRAEVRIQAYCVMPNHFHLIAIGGADGAISSYIQRVTGRHSCQVRRDTGTRGRGHVYQGRYWCEAIRTDRDFLAVQRYVEANPLRAKLVGRAESWRWGSLWERETGGRRLLDSSSVPLPADWVGIVNGSDCSTMGSDPSAPPARGQTPV